MKQLIKKLAIVLSVALVCAPMGAMAANKLIVKDAAGTVDKFVVTDTGKLGVNITNPTYGLHIMGTSDVTSTAGILAFPGRTLAAGSLKSDAPTITFIKNNDPSINSGMLQADDRLGFFGFGTRIGTSNQWLASVAAYSAGLQTTTTSAPSYLVFSTAATGSVTAAERLRILSNGNIGIGTVTANARLEVNGGVRINPIPAGTTAGTCNGAFNGTLWFTKGSTVAPVTADKLELCAKDAANNYSWRQIF